MIHDPRQHEEQVGQTIDVLEQHRLDGRVHPHHFSLGAALHVARVVSRRAERRMVALEPAVEPVLLRYINRLSDLLFVLARVVNQRAGAVETIW